eukprot:59642-Pelagomonas_calceolata.AAC.1
MWKIMCGIVMRANAQGKHALVRWEAPASVCAWQAMGERVYGPYCEAAYDCCRPCLNLSLCGQAQQDGAIGAYHIGSECKRLCKAVCG